MNEGEVCILSQSHQKQQAVDMTSGSIVRHLIAFTVPLLLGNLFQQLYNTVDSLFVGSEALAAVGSTTSIVNMLVLFFNGVSIGAGVVISRYFGSHNDAKLHVAVETTIAVTFICGIVLTGIGIYIAPFMLELMDTPEDVLPLSSEYLQIYFAGISGLLIYNMGSGILRSVGDTKRPLYFLCFSSLLNIVLDLWFVISFQMGVAGVAYATIISQFASAALVLLVLTRSTENYRLVWKDLSIDKGILKQILRIGLPSGLQSTMYNIANMVIQTALNSFGTDTMAAWTAFGKVDSFYWMISSAFGVAITTFVGQNYGAGKIDRMKKSVRVCFCMDLATALTLSALMYLFLGKFLLSLFTTDAEVLSIGVRIMQIIVPAYAPFVFIEIFSGALRGAGNVLIPMLLTCGGICVTRILWIFFFVPSHRAVETIIFSYPGSWVLTATLFILYFAFYTRRHWGRGATRDLK